MGDISETNGKPHGPVNGHVNGYIVVPKWFVSFLSFVTSVVFVGAVLWAWSISNDVSAIKAELNAATNLRTAELNNLRQRLERHDLLLDRVFERLNPAVREPAGAAAPN